MKATTTVILALVLIVVTGGGLAAIIALAPAWQKRQKRQACLNEALRQAQIRALISGTPPRSALPLPPTGQPWLVPLSPPVQAQPGATLEDLAQAVEQRLGNRPPTLGHLFPPDPGTRGGWEVLE